MIGHINIIIIVSRRLISINMLSMFTHAFKMHIKLHRASEREGRAGLRECESEREIACLSMYVYM